MAHRDELVPGRREPGTIEHMLGNFREAILIGRTLMTHDLISFGQVSTLF